MTDYILVQAVVPHGRANHMMDLCRNEGVMGGTILLVSGAYTGKWMEFFGLTETWNELLLMVIPKALENKVYDILWKEIAEHQNNHGIIFSIPVNTFSRGEIAEEFSNKEDTVEYEAIVTIVDRGKADDVIQITKDAGARGGTIFHGRGSADKEKVEFFGLVVDPEKELVLTLTKKEQAKTLTNQIYKKMELDQPGKGIVFVLPVTRTMGLAE